MERPVSGDVRNVIIFARRTSIMVIIGFGYLLLPLVRWRRSLGCHRSHFIRWGGTGFCLQCLVVFFGAAQRVPVLYQD